MEDFSELTSRVEQLQAADLPSALRGLLQHAPGLLKPRSRGAAGAPPPPAASRHALVSGILLLLERTATLAAERGDLKLVEDVHSQLVASFRQHAWLWELLLRKHLPALLQHPAAAQLFAEALAQLSEPAQARAYRLWRQELQAQPQLAGQVPLGALRALLQQLQLCFRVRSTVSLPLVPGLGPAEEGGTAAAAAAAGSAGAPLHSAGAAAGAAGMHIVPREHLPALLQLLLLLTCTDSGQAAAGKEQPGVPEGGACGAARAGTLEGACLSSMQSAATGLRPPRNRGQQQQQEREPAGSTCSGGSGGPGMPMAGSSGGASVTAGGGSTVRDGVLLCAVRLVSQLSDPDALHGMLGIEARQQQQDGSDTEGEEEAGGHGRRGGGAGAAAAGLPGRLSARDSGRVRTCQGLMVVCLDALLTLPAVAAAVHHRLHSKGSSTGGSQEGVAAAGIVRPPGGSSGPAAGEDAALGSANAGTAAPGEEEEQAAAAAAEAEMRHTAGAMLGLHRELSRFRLALLPSTASQQGLAAPQLSLPACQRLLSMLADTRAAQTTAGAAGRPSQQQQQQQQQPAKGMMKEQLTLNAASKRLVGDQGLPALLLMPPQLVAHGVDLVGQAVQASAAGISSSGGSSSSSNGSSSAAAQGAVEHAVGSWSAELAEQAAAIYASCHQAMWGAKVLQSAEAYQLLLLAARLRMRLREAAYGSRPRGGSAAADDEAEAAAEAALLAEHAIGGRRRRQRSSAHEHAGLAGRAPASARAPGSELPPAKRAKLAAGPAPSSGGTSAVAELLQLFQTPTGDGKAAQGEQQAASGSQQAASQPSAAVPSSQAQQQQQQGRQERQKPARKRITPQQIGPAPSAAQQQPLPASEPATGLAGALGGAAQPQPERAEGSMKEGEAEGEDAGRGQHRVIISKAANMTDEEQDALWEAYIADKELMAEMLGDSDYQQWFDESAHPLRRQHRLPGGLEAALTAVLGPSSAGSLVQQQLPRTLLEASSSMPWDVAAAACLRLLCLLLRAAGRAGGAGGSGGEAQRQLLQRAFSQQQWEAGARAATRACGLCSVTVIDGAVKACRACPAAASVVLLAAQLSSLLEGHNFFELQFNRAERRQAAEQGPAEGGRLVAPPLLEAYSELLAELLPAAREEERCAAVSRLAGRGWQLGGRPLELAASMAQQLMLRPPPLQHMLGPACSALLRLAVPPSSSRQQAVQQQAGLLWMLARQQVQGSSGSWAGPVQLPADAPAWLEEEEGWLAAPREGPGRGHALLLGPLPEVRQAAAAELLAGLQQHLEAAVFKEQQQQDDQRGSLQAAAGAAAAEAAAAAAGAPSGAPVEPLSAEVLLPAADACLAAIEVLLLEQQRAEAAALKGPDGEEGKEEEAADEDDESAPQLLSAPLLLGSAAAVGELAASLCCAGAAAGAQLAARLEAAAGMPARAEQQAGDGAGSAAPDASTEAAAGALAVCMQLAEPAELLLQSGALPAAVQEGLEAALEALAGEQQGLEQALQQLPPELLQAVVSAMESAPTLWQPTASAGASEQEEGGEAASGSESEGGRGGRHAGKGRSAGGSSGRQQGRRRKRLRDVRNPAVRAMLAEDGGFGDLDADDLSDLEDFIVCNPERDYARFFSQHFYHVRDSSSESEGEEEAGGEQQEGPAEEEAAAQDHERQQQQQGQRSGDRPSSKQKPRRDRCGRPPGSSKAAKKEKADGRKR